MSHRKTQSYGKIYCNKHYKQLRKYGKTIDINPRTIADKNEIHVWKDFCTMYLYNNKCEHIATAKFDERDLDKVRYVKWKLSHSGYAMNSGCRNSKTMHMSRIIMNLNDPDLYVDHINHDTLDNRRSNLRIVNKSQNQMNSERQGYSINKKGLYIPHIKKNQRMLNLGVYGEKIEALYARWYAEQILFGQYAYSKEKPKIPPYRAKDIEEYVNKKVQRL